MKKVLKISAYVVGIVILLIACLLTYLKIMLPSVGDATDLKVETNDDRIERGKYLANHVMVCMDCHSKRDWSKFSGPLVDGTLGSGGEVFDQKLGFPGKYVANNITPSHLGSWTDGEIFRALTSGVSKDGRALFPIMPYLNFRLLDEEDVKSVITYIRTLTPIENKTEASRSDFPMNFIINTMPKKPRFAKMPGLDDKVNYGKYLATAAGCNDCHTKQEKGKFIGEPFAGGFDFRLLDGSIVTSSNITPHLSGIGGWTEEQFIARFKIYSDTNYFSPKVSSGEFQTVMPWTMYTGMTKQDLSAIYQYLLTLPPKDNTITRFKSAKQ
jgi:hypothetical protein